MSTTPHLDDLFEPSLTKGYAGRAPYSNTATFLTAFFGGIVAAACISGLNTWRLRRPSWEYALHVAFLVGGVWMMFQLGQWMAMDALPDWLNGHPRLARDLNKGVGLVVTGLFYLLHRRERKAFELSGADEPNGWPAGLAILALATALNMGAMYLGGAFD